MSTPLGEIVAGEFNYNHEKTRKRKVYVRLRQKDVPFVWFEVDLGEDDDSNKEIKLRRMEWVDPYEAFTTCVTATVGSSIYLLGGEELLRCDSSCYLTDVFYLDTTNPKNNEFQVAPSMKDDRTYRDVIQVHDGKIYVFGEGREIFDPNTTSWNVIRGHPFDTYPAYAVGSISDPKRCRILVCFRNETFDSDYELCLHCENGGDILLYEYKPRDDYWNCLNPCFEFPSGASMELSVILGDFIIVKVLGKAEFVSYDLVKHVWSPVVWDGGKFDDELFPRLDDYWISLLHLGNGTLFMGRHNWFPAPNLGIYLECLTFKVRNTTSGGSVVAYEPLVKSPFPIDGNVANFIILD